MHNVIGWSLDRDHGNEPHARGAVPCISHLVGLGTPNGTLNKGGGRLWHVDSFAVCLRSVLGVWSI